MPNSIGSPVKFGFGRLRKRSIGILDDISGVAAAYALRKLRKDYDGPIVEVRNSSGNLANIYAGANGELDITAYNNHVAGGTGYVKTLYDQSGNGRDASQSTTIKQPEIALSVANGKPAILYSNVYKSLKTAAFAHFPSKRGGFIIAAKNSSNLDQHGALVSTFDAAPTGYVFYAGRNLYKWYDGGKHNYQTSGDNYSAAIIQSIFRDGDTTAKFRRNGSLQHTWNQSNNQPSSGVLAIGNVTGDNGGYIGHIFDIIEFSSAIPAGSHNAIGNNMAARYGLSWTNVT